MEFITLALYWVCVHNLSKANLNLSNEFLGVRFSFPLVSSSLHFLHALFVYNIICANHKNQSIQTEKHRKNFFHLHRNDCYRFSLVSLFDSANRRCQLKAEVFLWQSMYCLPIYECRHRIFVTCIVNTYYRLQINSNVAHCHCKTYHISV